MDSQKEIDFNRIAKAISYIRQNFKSQPSLDEVAEKVNLSPFHFQRMFKEWAGVSPKKFLQYTSVQYARRLLRNEQATLFDASVETGLSGSSRLHDLFITIEGMTPAEYKQRGSGLQIGYSFVRTPFGKAIVGSTSKGICYMAFVSDEDKAVKLVKEQFTNSIIEPSEGRFLRDIQSVFEPAKDSLQKLKLHLKGTPFQLKVWEALLRIPPGKLTTYGELAKEIQNPGASRAVGSAVGDNPVAYLIPCHRVIRSTGDFGEYHWGSDRKIAIIGWEGVNTHRNEY